MISLSVIVCTRDRPQQLRRCLARIGSLVHPTQGTVEILVVNNGRRDGVPELVDEVARGASLPFRYLEEPAPGLARGRNRGLAEARGEIIAFTDDDCLPAEDWLAALETAFCRRAVDLLGGRVELHSPSDRPVTIKTKPRRESLLAASDLDGFLHGCNFAFRRSVVERIGGFDPRLGAGSLVPGAEDTDLVYRAFRAGFGVSYEPSVVVAHAHGRKTARAEARLRRRYRIALGALQTKYALRGDRDMRAWLVRDLRRHLGAAGAAWRSPARMAAALRLASHHLQGAARYLVASKLLRGDGEATGVATAGNLPTGAAARARD